MVKVTKRARQGLQSPRVPAGITALLTGVALSLVVSMVALVFLALVSLATDGLVVENCLRYITVGVTMVSIFIGAAYAAQRLGSAGLLVGMTVGLVYVLVSLLVGLEFTQDELSAFVLTSKFLAGIAAGGLGGMVGVNL